jgi:hypothetical protein
MNDSQRAILLLSKFIALAGIGALASCSGEQSNASAPRAVNVVKVSNAKQVSQVAYSGEILPRYETALGFRVPGKLVARLADVGDEVKASMILARLDPQDQKLNSQAVRSRLAARLPADSISACRRERQRPGADGFSENRPQARRDSSAVATPISHRNGRRHCGKRERAKFDYRGYARHAADGTHVANDSIAEYAAHRDGDHDGSAGTRRRGDHIVDMERAVWVCREPGCHRIVRNDHAQLRNPDRSDRAGHRGRSFAVGRHCRGNRTPVSAYRADGINCNAGNGTVVA